MTLRPVAMMGKPRAVSTPKSNNHSPITKADLKSIPIISCWQRSTLSMWFLVVFMTRRYREKKTKDEQENEVFKRWKWFYKLLLCFCGSMLCYSSCRMIVMRSVFIDHGQVWNILPTLTVVIINSVSVNSTISSHRITIIPRATSYSQH